jgi:hypothetical protein
MVVMSRPRKLANSVKLRLPKPLELTTRDWLCVERALGATLSQEQRAQIVELSNQYIRKAEVVRSSASLSDVEAWLDQAMTASERMAALFSNAPRQGSRGAVTLGRANVFAHLHTMLKAAGHNGKIPIDDIITMLPAAIDATRARTGDIEASSREDGKSWGHWIRGLHTYFADQSLPCRSRHDGHLGGGFIKFVAAFQELIPEADRAHMPSSADAIPDALAKAISRALKSLDR